MSTTVSSLLAFACQLRLFKFKYFQKCFTFYISTFSIFYVLFDLKHTSYKHAKNLKHSTTKNGFLGCVFITHDRKCIYERNSTFPSLERKLSMWAIRQ